MDINKIKTLRELDKDKDFIDDDLFNFAVEHNLEIDIALLIQIIRELKKK
jgi:predicted class III extradiol MEMO1 family dioxygenase